MPWWALGASGMSSNLDVAGTAAIVALIYHFGLHGFFIEFRGGVVLPIAVWLAFMGKWHRRSGVTTTGEWMLQRFGTGPGGAAARAATAMTYLVITIGMVFFFLSAAGNFVAEFWPDTPPQAQVVQLQKQVVDLKDQADVTLSDDLLSAARHPTASPTPAQLAAATELQAVQAELAPLRDERRTTERWLAIAMALIALVYTAAAGLYGVVWTDVFQAFIIGAAAIYTSVIAFNLVTPELIEAWPGAALNTAYPQLYNEALDKSEVDGVGVDYSLFGLFLCYFLAKGLIEGLGGSGGSAYMAQRFYAARDDAATRKITMLWAILFTFRWPMVLGFAIIAIHIGVGAESTDVLLPAVLKSEYFPVGIRGLLIAALFAASMSTFDSTINAGASYIVKDVFAPLFPFATPRQQVIVGYVASGLIVATGLALTLAFPTGVLAIWQTIVLLFSAFLVPFALRWFWPRMNGWGFTGGIVVGFAAFVVLRATGLSSELNEAVQFASYAGASLVACVLFTYLTPKVEESTLLEFYRRTRPLGPWPKRFRSAGAAGDQDAVEHRNDAGRLTVALLWQIFTFLLPMLAVLKMWVSFTVIAVPWVFLTIALWRDARGTPGDERPVE
jgi:Na+/proline symporter